MNAYRERLAVRARRRSPRARRPQPLFGIASALCALGLVAAACSSKPGASTSTSTVNTSPPSTQAGGNTGTSSTGDQSVGVTSDSVTVGQVDDLTVPLPGLFKGAEDGTKAYFAYVNSLGGVNGRKLILDAQDSLFQPGQVAQTTGQQIRSDFALVGGFSLLDGAEKPLVDLAHVPVVGFPLDASLASDPYVYSPLPNPEKYYPLGLFKYLKSKFPNQVKHVGIIWENATASTKAAEQAVEAAMQSVGFKILYDRGVGPFDTNFLPDIIAMKQKGVTMFFSQELPDNYAATLAKQFQQQNFNVINIEGAAYSSQLLKLAGSAANKMYIEQAYALYLGQDASTVPAIKQFTTWMHKVDSQPNFEIESVYGWTSAELFVQALREAGNPPTRSGLLAALNKVTLFNGGGLVPPGNPAQNIPSGCFLLAQVQNGVIKRVAPTPAQGFYCGSSGFLAAPGYSPVVRPSS